MKNINRFKLVCNKPLQLPIQVRLMITFIFNEEQFLNDLMLVRLIILNPLIILVKCWFLSIL